MAGARKTTWGALAAPRKGHEQESTRSDVVAEDGERKGLVCERYGAGTTEVHSLHSEVVVEGEESCGVRKDSVLCTVRHRGSALDRSGLEDSETSRLQTRKSRRQRARRILRRKNGQETIEAGGASTGVVPAVSNHN
jgi:hypothetical protein